MARRRRKRRADEEVFGILFGIVTLVVIATSITAKFGRVTFDFSTITKIIFLLAGLGAAIIAGLYFLQQYRERKYRAFLVEKQKYLNDWFDMTPDVFEKFVAGVFEKQGFKAKVTDFVKDNGIDIVLTAGDKKYAVQVKQYRDNKIPEKDVRDLFGCIRREHYAGGYFVTTSSFTKPAQDWIKGQNLTLIDGDALVRMVNQ